MKKKIKISFPKKISELQTHGSGVDYFAHRKIALECGLTFFFCASLYKSPSLHQNILWRTFCIDAAEDPILNIAPRDFLHNIVYSVNNYMSTNHPLCTFKAAEDPTLNIARCGFVYSTIKKRPSTACIVQPVPY